MNMVGELTINVCHQIVLNDNIAGVPIDVCLPVVVWTSAGHSHTNLSHCVPHHRSEVPNLVWVFWTTSCIVVVRILGIPTVTSISSCYWNTKGSKFRIEVFSKVLTCTLGIAYYSSTQKMLGMSLRVCCKTWADSHTGSVWMIRSVGIMFSNFLWSEVLNIGGCESRALAP